MSRRSHLVLTGWLVALLIWLSLAVVNAQDSLDTQPLLQMLARVPDNAISRSEIYFDDRTAVEAAYPGAKLPADWAAFAAYQADNGKSDSFKPIDLWWKVWRNQQSSQMGRYLTVSDKMPEVVGFDFFTVTQEMTYGLPPLQTLMLNGAFDLDKVRAALTGQGFTEQDQSGVAVWCGPDGCDSGAKVNVRDRNPANPFGGDLGRKWPMIVQHGSLIGSPSLDVIQQHVAVQNGGAPSLGAAPEYRAAVDALTTHGVLMQAYFWDGDTLATLRNLDPFLATVKPAVRKQLLEALLKEYEPMPIFDLLAFGDIANETEAGGEVALVYANAADAQAAAAILPKRIASYTSIAMQKPFVELLLARGVTEPKVQVVESYGHSVVLVSFIGEKLSVDDLLKLSVTDSGAAGIIPPGMVYRLLIDAALKRDLGWLSMVPRATLEAAAK